MYNRYIPQPDGSYQKSRHQDQLSPPQPPSSVVMESPVCQEPPHEEPARPAPQKPTPCPHMRPPRHPRPIPPPKDKPEPTGIGIGNFFRQLLPRDFDTGDLIVILLLLLMSSDCQEEQNTALLTLALYLFL